MRRRVFLSACVAALAAAGLLGLGRLASAEEQNHVAKTAAASEVVAADAGVIPGPGPVSVPTVGVGQVGHGRADDGIAAGALAAVYSHQPVMCLPRDYLNPTLFYNFYVGGNCGSIPAGMYPTPMPTPPLVGHTYFTYQPLLPHEFMYAHYRVYHHHYNHNRGLHRTRVIWAW